MQRLLVHVEGYAEAAFVDEVFSPYLLSRGYESVKPRLLGNARLRRARGGIKPWVPVRKEIVNHLRQDAGLILTTMVDYYAMPRDWPGREAPGGAIEAPAMLDSLLNDVVKEMGSSFDRRRFVPYVAVH